MPKISVIVPVYKAEAYLHRCVGSLLTQTFTDFEVLLVDDGSPDRSGAICDEYARRDSRVRVFHKENGGVSSARNYGISKAEGLWLLFVDSDDWCNENYIECFFKTDRAFDEDDLVVQGKFNDELGGECIREPLPAARYFNNVAECIKENDLLSFGAPYCKLFSRALITQYDIKFPENYSYGEDTTFFFKYLLHVKNMIALAYEGYHYVQTDNSSLSRRFHDFLPLCAFIKDSLSLVVKIYKGLSIVYNTSCIRLLVRAELNMFRLKYPSDRRHALLRQTKNELLPLMSRIGMRGCTPNILLLSFKLPVKLVDMLYSLLYSIRK